MSSPVVLRQLKRVCSHEGGVQRLRHTCTTRGCIYIILFPLLVLSLSWPCNLTFNIERPLSPSYGRASSYSSLLHRERSTTPATQHRKKSKNMVKFVPPPTDDPGETARKVVGAWSCCKCRSDTPVQPQVDKCWVNTSLCEQHARCERCIVFNQYGQEIGTCGKGGSVAVAAVKFYWADGGWPKWVARRCLCFLVTLLRLGLVAVRASVAHRGS